MRYIAVSLVDDRLDSWKDIAAYLKRDVSTVQRWEKREGMPVHRHLHEKLGSVYAFRAELDAWSRSRNALVRLENDVDAAASVGLDSVRTEHCVPVHKPIVDDTNDDAGIKSGPAAG